ncbi:MAG TPA: EAL domain-containing protein [Aeromicrobium sp.]|nr:EAL domain-containing protein [Aeromicrobium sp.]
MTIAAIGSSRVGGRLALAARLGNEPAWPLAAVEHAADAIVVADLDGTVRYVNPAFESHTGLRTKAVLGKKVTELATPVDLKQSTTSVWETVQRGHVWRGELLNKRRDGTLAHGEATIAPVRDAQGTLVGAVAIMRDLTRQRALEAHLDDYRRERRVLAATLSAMRSGDTAEATAAAIGRALLELEAFRAVGVLGLASSGEVLPLAVLDPDGSDVTVPGPLPPARSKYLRERASRGPWIENWAPEPDHPYRSILSELDVRVIAYVPIRSGDEAIGLLAVSAAGDDGLGLTERLPALVECGAYAGALLAGQLRSRNARALDEKRIQAIITDRLYLPMFQPIVDLGQGVTVGYEALTRFADGSPPDRVFAEAARSGLAIDLERGTLEAIFAAAASLPEAASLNVNVSAELVLAGDALAAMLRKTTRQIVLELTEHTEVTDYDALRAAIVRLRPRVRLAVDDAGAGFASLRHILELNPDFVKLDKAIVHRVDCDPARQALIAGMVHFAAQINAGLMAEGIERDAEAKEIYRLGVKFGQGYRLGRPGLAGRVASRAPRASVPESKDDPADVVPVQLEADSRRRYGPDDIGRAVNLGLTLARALREAGIATVSDLRALGAVAAWEQLRSCRPNLATGTTLLQLEGATRGMRITELPHAERARLRLFAKLARRAF